MSEDLFWISKRWRKKIPRKINFTPLSKEYNPDELLDENTVILFHDEIEALRLKNLNKLSVRTWATQMWISKSLFAKIHNEAITKLTHAIVHGKKIYLDTENHFLDPIV